jgi:hypothetical protein
MIKKYNQFVNDRVNEDVDNFEDDTNQQESELANTDLDGEFDGMKSEVENLENVESEEEEPEEEGGDVYASKLKEVADKLGSEVNNGRVEYKGQKIMFPSETEMYHVGGKKFKTADEVVSFLGDTKEESTNMEEMERVPNEDINIEESKSYKNTRRFKK